MYFGYDFTMNPAYQFDPSNTSFISADSHTRYLSGLLFAIGLCFWSTIPDILNKASRFQLLTIIVFTGGLARLSSVVLYGYPGPWMSIGLSMELVVTPLLCGWQQVLSKKIK